MSQFHVELMIILSCILDALLCSKHSTADFSYSQSSFALDNLLVIGSSAVRPLNTAMLSEYPAE